MRAEFNRKLKGRLMAFAMAAVFVLAVFSAVPATDAAASPETIDGNTDYVTKEIVADTVIGNKSLVRVSESLTIAAGATLTVQEGSALAIGDDTGQAALNVEGKLVIESSGYGPAAGSDKKTAGLFVNGDMTVDGTMTASAGSLVYVKPYSHVTNNGNMGLSGNSDLESDLVNSPSGNLKISGEFQINSARTSIKNSGTAVIDGAVKADMELYGNASVSIVELTRPMDVLKDGKGVHIVPAGQFGGLTVKAGTSGCVLSGDMTGKSAVTVDGRIDVDGTLKASADVALTNNGSIYVSGLMEVEGTGVAGDNVFACSYTKGNTYCYSGLGKALASSDSVYVNYKEFTFSETSAIPAGKTVTFSSTMYSVEIAAGKTVTVERNAKIVAENAVLKVSGTLVTESAGSVSVGSVECEATYSGTDRTVYSDLEGLLPIVKSGTVVLCRSVILTEPVTVPSDVTLEIGKGLTLDCAGRNVSVNGVLFLNEGVLKSASCTLSGEIRSVTEMKYSENGQYPAGAYFSVTGKTPMYYITTVEKAVGMVGSADGHRITVQGTVRTGDLTIEGTASYNPELIVNGDFGCGSIVIDRASVTVNGAFEGRITDRSGFVETDAAGRNSFTVVSSYTSDLRTLTVSGKVVMDDAAAEHFAVGGRTVIGSLVSDSLSVVSNANAEVRGAVSVKDLFVDGDLKVNGGSSKVTVSGAASIGIDRTTFMTTSAGASVNGNVSAVLTYISPSASVNGTLEDLGSITYKVGGKTALILSGKAGTPVPEISIGGKTAWTDNRNQPLPPTFGNTALTAVPDAAKEIYSIEISVPDEVESVVLDRNVVLVKKDGMFVTEHNIAAGEYTLTVKLKDSVNGSFKVKVNGSECRDMKVVLKGGEPELDDKGQVVNPVVYAVTVEYVPTEAENIDRITVMSTPDKVLYNLGESIVTDGLRVMAYYKDGHSADVTSKCAVTPGVFDTPGTVKVTVTYLDTITADFNVKVKDGFYQVSVQAPEQVVTVSVDGKAFERNGEGLFVIGSNFGKGVHTLEYTLRTGLHGTVGMTVNGTPSEGSSFTAEGGDPTFDANDNLIKGVPYGIVLTYTADDEDLESIVLRGDYRKEYNTGDAFDRTGLEVVAHYVNGRVMKLDSYTVDPQVFRSPGTVKVTVAYDGLTASFDVVVKVKDIDPVVSMRIDGDSMTGTQTDIAIDRIEAVKVGDPDLVPVLSIWSDRGTLSVEDRLIDCIRTNGAVLEFETMAGRVSFTADALEPLKTDGESVTLSFNVVPVPEIHMEYVGAGIVVDVGLSIGTERFSGDFGDDITVYVRCNPSEETNTDHLDVIYLMEDGETKNLGGSYMTDDGQGFVEFSTDHFSMYTVKEVEPKGVPVWAYVGAVAGILAGIVIVVMYLRTSGKI